MHNKSWSGHIWQGRFSSFPMDEDHLYPHKETIEISEDWLDWI